MIWIGAGCSDSIPEKVVLEDKPRELVSQFCACYQEIESYQKCWRASKKDIQIALKNVYGKDRLEFIQQVLHSFVESDCFDSELSQKVMKEFKKQVLMTYE